MKEVQGRDAAAGLSPASRAAGSSRAASSLHMLRSPAPAAAPPLVLLHGLGFSGAVWQVLAEELRQDFCLWVPDLPGFGHSAPPAPGNPSEALLAAMLPHLPPRACFLGWSLGGHLALDLAIRFPQRVSALITIGTNPCFQQRPGWLAGVPAEELAAFREIAADGRGEGRRRLASLIARGEPEPLSMVRRLRRLAAGSPPSADGMRAGLDLLAEADLRDGLQALQIPVLHILGDGDALVPAALAEALRTLCSTHRVMELSGTGHAPFLSRPAVVAAAVRCFAADNGLLPPPPQPLDQRRVAISFDRAASGYDRAADLQREMGKCLLARVVASCSGAGHEESPSSQRALPAAAPQHESAPLSAPQRLLDLGCGTGYFLAELGAAFPAAQCLAIDLAQSMLHTARTRAAACSWLCADAACLPLAANTLQLIFANLVFQWCGAPADILREMFRVLRPGGCLAFTTFGPETLWELRTAWRAADEGSHVRRFPSAASWRRAAAAAGLDCTLLQTELRRRRYPSLRALAAELKALGAHNSTRTAAPGLTAPGRLAAAEAAYEALRGQTALPATFQVIFGLLVKP